MEETVDWKSATQNEQGLFNIPKRWLLIHYYDALSILFRFENSLRVFVYTILKNKYFDQWMDCNFSMNQGDSQAIKSIASKRIKQADSYGYLGYDITAPLMHLTSGELVEIMVCDAYWPLFKEYFRGNKEIIKNKLLEIGAIRNSLAHFRPIKPEDIELIKQNARHALIGVEDCLANLFSQNIRVPTNSDEEWYKLLSTIGTEHTSSYLYHSENESWIKSQIQFKMPILGKNKIDDTFYTYNICTAVTPNILVEKPELTKFLTYIFESVTYPSIDEDWNITIVKNLNFVFNKHVLTSETDTIAAALRDIASIITEECELLLNDNLARGKIIKNGSVTAWFYKPENEQGRINFQYNSLSEPYKSEHPNEYWGQQIPNRGDVVAGSIRYPWMPDDISIEEGYW